MKKKRIFYTVFAVLTALVLFAVISLQQRANRLLADTANAQITAIISGMANSSVLDIMSASDTYTDLVQVQCDALGNVSYISADSVRLNALAYRTAKQLQSELDGLASQSIPLYITALFGIDLLSGMGPTVSVTVKPIGSVQTRYISEFASAGINQTRHRIYLEITDTVWVVMPAESKRIDVLTQVVVSECLIVGTVPDSYVYVDETDKMLNLIPD